MGRQRLVDQGAGKTVNASRGGILFDAGRPLPIGANIELRIKWPVRLRQVTLELLIWGRTIRNERRGTAIRTSRHEFRIADARGENSDFAKSPARAAAGASLAARTRMRRPAPDGD